MTVYGLIPAAGKSVRMGCPKLALPLGDRTVLEHVVAALRTGGADGIVVVTRPDAMEVIDIAQRIGVDLALLPGDTPDMRATVQFGLRWLEQHKQPTDADALLLSPADHPTLHADVVQMLRRAAESYPESSIFVPTHEGQRGHPILVRWRHVAGLLQVAEGQGLNTYFRAHAAQRREVPYPSPEILWDLDTPEDYERLQRAMDGQLISSPATPAPPH